MRKFLKRQARYIEELEEEEEEGKSVEMLHVVLPVKSPHLELVVVFIDQM